MGVPRLFPWVAEKFAHAVTHIDVTQSNQALLDAQSLYLDNNGDIHGAAQEVYGYASGKSDTSPYTHFPCTMDECAAVIGRKVFTKIERYVSFFRNLEHIYISYDGPAPVAKQAQQRQRRFISANADADAGKDPLAFNSTFISPGTEFMQAFYEDIKYRIHREMNRPGSRWKSLTVVLSPWTVPGEGEHKCMNEIRRIEQENIDRPYRHVFVGPDADLIMLSLASKVRDIYLFREDQFKDDHVHLVNISAIGARLAAQMGIEQARIQMPIYRAIESFIFIGLFVGNDFLPKIKMFHHLQDGLDMAITMIRNQIKVHGANGLLMVNDRFQFDGLESLIGEFSKREHALLTEQLTDPRNQPYEDRFINTTLLEHFNPSTQQLDYNSYRSAYYKKFMNDDHRSIERICIDYLKTLYWVYIYYIRGVPSWTWLYTYHYAPLMTDLYHVIQHLDDAQIRYITQFKSVSDRPPMPHEQLLAILPPRSFHLLPNVYRSALTHAPEYYPLTFDLDCEGKHKEYQCIPLLPFPDPEFNHRLYQEYRIDHPLNVSRKYDIRFIHKADYCQWSREKRANILLMDEPNRYLDNDDSVMEVARSK